MTAPQKSESPVGAGLIAEQSKRNGGDSRSGPRATQALCAIEGERKAREYLARLYGATLRGFCTAIAKALRGGAA